MVFLSLILEGGSMKPKINFYKDGELLWLIDTTEKNMPYSMKTKEEYVREGYSSEGSYENYLNYVNTKKEYKYTNWRLPTKKELLRLELKDTFFRRLFSSNVQKNTQICIDVKLFYDHVIRHINEYWTSDSCITGRGKDGYISVDFKALRFNPKSYSKASPAWGISYGCTAKHGKYNIRFVRDIK